MSTSTADEPRRTPALELVTFVPDVLRMFTRVARDPRVPMLAKVQAGALLALGISPLDAIPVVGQLEIVAAIALAARQLIRHAGEDVVREHWQGTDEGLRLLLVVVETGLKPRKLLMAVARHRH